MRNLRKYPLTVNEIASACEKIAARELENSAPGDIVPACLQEAAARVRQESELVELCKKFIQENRITCAETVAQSDRVIENAYDFIESVCSIVGYYDEPD